MTPFKPKLVKPTEVYDAEPTPRRTPSHQGKVERIENDLFDKQVVREEKGLIRSAARHSAQIGLQGQVEGHRFGEAVRLGMDVTHIVQGALIKMEDDIEDLSAENPELEPEFNQMRDELTELFIHMPKFAVGAFLGRYYRNDPGSDERG